LSDLDPRLRKLEKKIANNFVQNIVVENRDKTYNVTYPIINISQYDYDRSTHRFKDRWSSTVEWVRSR